MEDAPMREAMFPELNNSFDIETLHLLSEYDEANANLTKLERCGKDTIAVKKRIERIRQSLGI
jgi:hypothetical protein